MFYSGIFTVLCSTIACSFGFTMDRSVYVPATWDTAPSLDSYRRILGNSTLNSKMQVTDMNKILQATNAKVSTKLTDGMPENQMREKRSTTEYINAGTKIVNDVTSEMKNNTFNSSEKNISVASTSRNVILLLIDKMDQDEKKEEDLWKNYKEKLPFAIEGFLQNCGNKMETSFPLDNVLISDDDEENCDCQRILHSNVEELLFWARHMRGMTTGVISGSNFSIPSFPRSEFDGSNKSDAKLELHKSNVWQMMDLSGRAKSVPSLVMTDSKLKETTNYSTWDLFDVFSKIRMAFFRSLLESLGRNDRASENGFSSRKLFSLKPTVANLIGNIIKKLKSIPNNKGYILIATVPRNEQAAVVDLVQNETSPKDTLLVMMQICTRNKNPIPFIAQGPNNQMLREARAISELSIAIRKAVVSNCRGSECINRPRRDTSIISSMPIEIFSQKLSAQKRSSKDKDAAEKLNAILSTEEAPTIEKEKQARSSTSLKAKPYGLVTAIGVVNSVLVMAALTSS
nr:PREDICTED: uncharacterized protein LOC105673479 [Linepithema humile]